MKRFFCLLAALVCLCPAALGEGYALPADLSPAPAASESGYISATEYKDESLHVWIEDIERDDSVYHVAHVKIADPSQLRTGLSGEPGQKSKATVSQMAQAYNAVVAINGDYYLYSNKGYAVRQGTVLRKSAQTEYDMLVIDAAGDFHAVRKPTKAKIKEALALDVVNCFTFGPVLVMDGERQTVYNQYGFAAQDRSPRTAIGQTGPLEYALVVADGRQEHSRGVTHKQLAQFMADIGCTVAFNLDGGASSTLWFGG
ncbi:MAG: phosphodiester glycosidase family protein, partial [Eubacteriales bacterium]|nr:phosphodiester glycosidase family protein [Eubacteriales bacterium]